MSTSLAALACGTPVDDHELNVKLACLHPGGTFAAFREANFGFYGITLRKKETARAATRNPTRGVEVFAIGTSAEGVTRYEYIVNPDREFPEDYPHSRETAVACTIPIEKTDRDALPPDDRTVVCEGAEGHCSVSAYRWIDSGGHLAGGL